MSLQASPISSEALEAAIDSHPLRVAPETCLSDVIHLMCQVGTSCALSSDVVVESFPNQSPAQILLTTSIGNDCTSSCVLIMEGAKLLGLLTERDLVKIAAGGINLEAVTAASVMTSTVITLRKSDLQDVFAVLKLFCQHRICHLPIVDDIDQVLGIVKRDSIVRLIQILQQEFEQLQAEKIAIEQSALLQQAQIELAQRKETELKLQKANQALSRSIATNRALLKAIPDSMLRISRDSTLVNYKTGQDGTMPLPVKQFLGKNLNQILPAEIASLAMSCVERALETSEIQSLEYQLSLNDTLHDYEARFAVSDAEEVMVIIRDITERNQAVAALQQQLAAVEASIDGIAILNKEGKYIYINKAHVQLFGYHSDQELIGKSWSELYYLEEIDRFKCEILPILEQEGRWRGEAIAKRLDGSTFAEEISLTLTVEGSFVCICSDITERKQAEAALIASEERFRATFEQAAVGIAHTGFDGKFLRLNQKCCDIVGYTYEQMLTKSFVDITHPDDIDVDQRYVEQLLAGEIDTFSMEKRYYRQDNSIVWVNLTGSLVRKPSGELDYFVGVIEDINDRKRAEAALQDSEQKYRSVVESVKEVIFQTDLKGLWTFLNPAWTEITGFSIKDSLGNNFVNYIHPDDRKQCLELWQKLITGQQEYCRYEIRYLTKDNSFRWIETLARLALDAKGTIIGISGTLHDFTKRKQAEEELRKALEQEKELSELKSRFVSMTSHEFRTPLTTILGSTELLRYYSHKWNEQKKILHYDRIQANVQHMTKMLDDVLLLGKAEAGKLEFKPVPLDIVYFCRSLVEESQLSFGTKHEIIFTYQEQDINTHSRASSDTMQLITYARLDEKLLRHILSNLLSNAIKYSPTDSTIKFELDLQEKEVVFQIKDQGIGIPWEDQQHLFKSFHRARNVGKITGTGLGLAIVKKSIDLHGGKIKVDSKVGLGTNFTVHLPRVK